MNSSKQIRLLHAFAQKLVQNTPLNLQEVTDVASLMAYMDYANVRRIIDRATGMQVDRSKTGLVALMPDGNLLRINEDQNEYQVENTLTRVDSFALSSLGARAFARLNSGQALDLEL